MERMERRAAYMRTGLGWLSQASGSIALASDVNRHKHFRTLFSKPALRIGSTSISTGPSSPSGLGSSTSFRSLVTSLLGSTAPDRTATFEDLRFLPYSGSIVKVVFAGSPSPGSLFPTPAPG